MSAANILSRSSAFIAARIDSSTGHRSYQVSIDKKAGACKCECEWGQHHPDYNFLTDKVTKPCRHIQALAEAELARLGNKYSGRRAPLTSAPVHDRRPEGPIVATHQIRRAS